MSQPNYLTSIEQDILRVLKHLDVADALKIRDEIIEKVGQEYSLRSIHGVLKFMEEGELVVGREAPMGDQRSGKKNIIFSVTTKGQTALESFLAYLDALRAGAH